MKDKAEEVKAEVVGLEESPGPMAIIALVCGILSVLCHCVPVAGSFIGFFLSVAAIVLGIIEIRRIGSGEGSVKGKSMSIAGIILGAVGIVFGIILIVIISIASFAGLFGDWMNYY
ncbi:MAG: DUF4190 domain-containing protein [Actinobacteria bacterium]|nr:DUF4190 domain-containing protein [Actinomycetota bacterium]